MAKKKHFGNKNVSFSLYKLSKKLIISGIILLAQEKCHCIANKFLHGKQATWLPASLNKSYEKWYFHSEELSFLNQEKNILLLFSDIFHGSVMNNL